MADYTKRRRVTDLMIAHPLWGSITLWDHDGRQDFSGILEQWQKAVRTGNHTIITIIDNGHWWGQGKIHLFSQEISMMLEGQPNVNWVNAPECMKLCGCPVAPQPQTEGEGDE